MKPTPINNAKYKNKVSVLNRYKDRFKAQDRANIEEWKYLLDINCPLLKFDCSRIDTLYGRIK